MIAEPGRYLWITRELSGNTRTTPRLRVLTRRIPVARLSAPDSANLFTRRASVVVPARYLAIFEGALGELEAKADARRALLDPRSAPAEILPWLASFLGLILRRMDGASAARGRWRRRRAPHVDRGSDLALSFSRHGAWARRFLEIYLGVAPILIENFRVRGLAARCLANRPGWRRIRSRRRLSRRRRNWRQTRRNSWRRSRRCFRHARHRFTVIIPASLTPEQSEWSSTFWRCTGRRTRSSRFARSAPACGSAAACTWR